MTQKDRLASGWLWRFKGVVWRDWKIRPLYVRPEYERFYLIKQLILHCQEITSKFKIIQTVPKPTQVGEERILRRLRETMLRNSAN